MKWRQCDIVDSILELTDRAIVIVFVAKSSESQVGLNKGRGTLRKYLYNVIYENDVRKIKVFNMLKDELENE